MSGTKHSITNSPPGSSTRATLRKQSACRSWLSRQKSELPTTHTSRNGPVTGTSAMSPMVTGIASPPGLARIRSTIAREASSPSTATPRAASGSATRPVPIASSSTRPSAPASPARNPAARAGSPAACRSS
jgi:hypothetical protein